LDSSVSFDAGFFEVLTEKVALPDGSARDYFTVRHPGAVAVVAVDEKDRVLMVRQHRQAVDANLLELPAGKLDSGEDPEVCARRELEEETGYVCDELELLVSYYTSPGFTDERVSVFVGRALRRVAEPPGADGGEPISIDWLDKDEALAAILGGRIVDGKTIVGLALLELSDRAGRAGTG
jgi:ADP-ribose pyrophosphatase